MEGMNCDPAATAAHLAAVPGLARQTGKMAAVHARRPEAASLGLKESNVAKVVKDGTTQLAFMPSSRACVLAAADKKGYVRPRLVLPAVTDQHTHVPAAPGRRCDRFVGQPRPVMRQPDSNVLVQVGLWAHDPFDPDKAELAALAEDGVLLLHPHQQYVSGLAWLTAGSAGSNLVTSSYDGSVLLCDVDKAHFRVLHDNPADELSAMGSQDSNVLLTADNLVRPDPPPFSSYW